MMSEVFEYLEEYSDKTEFQNMFINMIIQGDVK